VQSWAAKQIHRVICQDWSVFVVMALEGFFN
jgi:hypothetical protein